MSTCVRDSFSDIPFLVALFPDDVICMKMQIGIDRKNKNVIQLYYKGDDIMAKEATLQVRMDAELKER